MKKREPKPKQRSQRQYREMTVALIRERRDADEVEVAFSESARFYRLSRQNPKFEDILRQLRQARSSQRVVRVLLDVPHGDVIEDAKELPESP